MTAKSPGCKLLHEEHPLGDPGPYCTGPDDTHLSDDGNPPPDEENDLLEQVKQLKAKKPVAVVAQLLRNTQHQTAPKTIMDVLLLYMHMENIRLSARESPYMKHLSW